MAEDTKDARKEEDDQRRLYLEQRIEVDSHELAFSLSKLYVVS